MKRTIQNILLAALVSTPVLARAEIPRDFHQLAGGGSCERQEVVSQTNDSEITVTDAVRCDSLYSDVQLIEIAVANKSLHKELYVYDWSEMYEFERNVKVQIVKDRVQFDQRDGVALYMGRDSEGRDVFLIRLVSAFRPKPAPRVDVYVKMGGEQFESTNVRLAQ